MGATYEVNITGEITYVRGIEGELSAHFYEGSFIPVKSVSGEVTVPDIVIPDEYDGTYEWTPSWDEQDIPTAHKYLYSDISINSIQLYEVSNESGGFTLII